MKPPQRRSESENKAIHGYDSPLIFESTMSARSAIWSRSQSPSESERPLITNPSPPFHQHVLNSVLNILKSILTWIKQTFQSTETIETTNSTSDEEDARIFLNRWLTSYDQPLCEYSDVMPEWFDSEKFARGGAFAMKNILGLVYAEQLALMLLLSLPMVRRPLIFTGKSDTGEKAFRRYLSTVERVVTWYSEDIWRNDSKAHHNLMVVRRMHSQAEHKMQSSPTPDRNAITQQFDATPSTPLLESIREDLAPYLPNAQQQKWLEAFNSSGKSLFINQLGMACTQLGFVGLLVLEPGKFGASRASSADLDDFVYVWYVLGHQLGIDDRFNLCAGGFQETRRRCAHIMRHIMLPSLAFAGNDWIHMSQCVIEGIDKILHQLSFQASFAYLMWALHVPAPRINSHIGWSELPRIRVFKAVLCIILGIPGFSEMFGKLLMLRLRRLRNRLSVENGQRRL